MDRHLLFGATLAFRSSGRAKSCTALLIIRPNLAALGLAHRNSRGGAVAQSKCRLPIGGLWELRPPCSRWHKIDRLATFTIPLIEICEVRWS
jgi:hypothetical protein